MICPASSLPAVISCVLSAYDLVRFARVQMADENCPAYDLVRFAHVQMADETCPAYDARLGTLWMTAAGLPGVEEEVRLCSHSYSESACSVKPVEQGGSS